jgi:hypothetical protein
LAVSNLFFSRISSVEDYVWQSSILSCCAFVLRPTTFTQGVKANVELKSSIPIGVKVENSPKQGLYTLGVKAEIEKIYF